ncbi:MAG: long-chain-fatty-acid--CoA ligase [Woeseiaceae bacterium]
MQPQSRAAILTGNNDLFFEIWLGSALGNFVLAPINARLAPPEVAYIVNDSRAEVLFVDEPFHELVAGIAAELTGARQIISLGAHADWPAYRQWRDGQSSDQMQLTIDPEETMIQMYTSGTTGFPKGVELNHASMLACVRSMMGRNAWQPNEVALVTAPLFHTAGSAWANCALQSGGTVVLLREATPAAMLNALETHSVTEVLMVPAVIQMLLQAPECATTDVSSLKRILYGAPPIPVPVLRQAVESFGCNFEQGYGLTETVGPVAMLRPEDHADDSKMESCGKAVPTADIRVVNSDGQDCATGEVGEIMVAGVQLMNGYWNRPEDTANAIRDGWLHTGDAGYFDSDGYLYIHDRLKDMIVSGAENVYPAEVERVLADYPDIADVAVIGVPDERWGEAVKAVVVAKPGVAPSEGDIIAYAHKHIAGFKCPKSVDFADAIPRNPSGKILKKELRTPYWEGYDRKIS